MSPPLLIALGFIVLILALIVLFAPKWAMLLIWPIWLCYPQRLFFGLLPWNAGLDDIFILLMAARMLFVPAKPGAAPWARHAVWLIAGLVLVEAIGNYTGTLRYPGLWRVATRDTLKGGVLLLATLAFALDVRRPEDVRRHAVAFLLSGSLAFLIVLLCYGYPSLARYWEAPTMTEAGTFWLGTARYRAVGPFNDTGDVGAAAAIMVPVGLALVIMRPRQAVPFLLGLIAMAMAAAGLVVSKSRQGVLGLSGMFAVMLLVSRWRWYVILLGIAGVLVALFLASAYTETAEVLEQRFTWARLTADLAKRADLWKLVITNSTPAVILCGEGWTANFLRLQASPHNAYLDALFLWGIGGVAVFSILVASVFKWSRYIAKYDPDALSRALGWGGLWVVVAILFLSLVTDTWIKDVMRLTTSFGLVLLCMRYRVLRYAAPAYVEPDEGAGHGWDREFRRGTPSQPLSERGC